MPFLTCEVDVKTIAVFEQIAKRNNTTITKVAEAALEDAAVRTVDAGVVPVSSVLNLGSGITLQIIERDDGSVVFKP